MKTNVALTTEEAFFLVGTLRAEAEHYLAEYPEEDTTLHESIIGKLHEALEAAGVRSR